MQMTITSPGRDDSLMASLLRLTSADLRTLHASTPRQLMSAVDPAWADDGAAWSLIQRFVHLARQRLRDLQDAGEMTSSGEARARWVYIVSLDLYDELRRRAIKAQATESVTDHS